MSRFRPVELHHASRLLNHGPTILITSYDDETKRRNVMAAAWSMPVEFEPPRIAIVVDKNAWSREIIERNGTFGIVVPGVAAANWTYAVGSISGREEDKFNAYGIPVINGPVLGLPVVEEKCLAWMECRLLPATAAASHYDTLFGEVVSAAADERALSPVVGSSTMISAIRYIILVQAPLSPVVNRSACRSLTRNKVFLEDCAKNLCSLLSRNETPFQQLFVLSTIPSSISRKKTSA